MKAMNDVLTIQALRSDVALQIARYGPHCTKFSVFHQFFYVLMRMIE